jgi:topoisomerase-4 subunit A
MCRCCSQVRIRRISLFDINKHREEMDRTKAELEETRKNLKNLTKYVIGHLEALLEKYGPMYPRLTTKSSRHEEVDVKGSGVQVFKVAYDRESGYVGYKVSGEEFKMECTKFDKILLVFKDGTYKVTELPEKLFVGPDLVLLRPAGPRAVFTCAYTDRNASYLKRFTFGGTIMNKAYSVHPGEVAHPDASRRHAEGTLRPLQTRAAPEDQSADLRPVAR